MFILQSLLNRLWGQMHPEDPDALQEYNEDTCETFDKVECPTAVINYLVGRKPSWSQKHWRELQNVRKMLNKFKIMYFIV